MGTRDRSDRNGIAEPWDRKPWVAGEGRKARRERPANPERSAAPKRATKPVVPNRVESKATEVHEDRDLLMGPRAVKEALLAGRQFNRISIAIGSEKAGEASEIRALAKQAGVIVQLVERAALDRMSGGMTHQGVVGSVAPFDYAELDDLFNLALGRKEPLFLVFLDGIMDPGNLGSIIRTANAAGADGVVITSRRCAQMTSAVARASAGALEHTPVARVSNLSFAIEKAKAAGLWVAGLDMGGEQTIWEADLKVPLAVVIGSEGTGMSRLVEEKCDFTLKIPMLGKISSLNAAVSFALVAYERVRQTSR
ncbi:MAG TPA: 23S rRNA (guanosine(2251)-2'-O)-methyltransferase RlmB [Bacillota bacterium]|nr:23S rRNA (guanosine(2251)-2'-O)-methyltransferase RlmB [Bacillota bacterium]HOG52376.1 23S rRNA (guanosine(2251)-2'-O)-methyltransferase RlmB [Bacillota bacterium]